MAQSKPTARSYLNGNRLASAFADVYFAAITPRNIPHATGMVCINACQKS